MIRLHMVDSFSPQVGEVIRLPPEPLIPFLLPAVRVRGQAVRSWKGINYDWTASSGWCLPTSSIRVIRS